MRYGVKCLMKLQNSVGGYGVNYPFRISFESLAAREMKTYEYEQGNTGKKVSPDSLKNPWFWETECKNDHFRTTNQSYIDYLDVEQNGNTYTVIITLPEWFDVSIYNDLTIVEVILYGTNFYSDLYQNGSAMFDVAYIFEP